MLKTTIISHTFTGGTTYDSIVPTTIPLFAQIQIKAPSGGLKYRINGTPATSYVSVSEDEYFQHPVDRASPQEPCSDTITILGSGAVPIEIQYYE